MPKMFFRALGAAFVTAALSVALFVWYMNYETPIGGDFELNYRGQEWNFKTDAKDVNLLYIGYAKCPDVCPMTLSIAAQAFKGLTADELKNTRLLFLSVDRDNETPDNVADYASQFNPNFLGFSGTREQIDKTVNQYHASYMVEKDEKSYVGYSIIHSDRLFFLDNKGHLIYNIPVPRSPEEITQKIKDYL